MQHFLKKMDAALKQFFNHRAKVFWLLTCLQKFFFVLTALKCNFAFIWGHCDQTYFKHWNEVGTFYFFHLRPMMEAGFLQPRRMSEDKWHGCKNTHKSMAKSAFLRKMQSNLIHVKLEGWVWNTEALSNQSFTGVSTLEVGLQTNRVLYVSFKPRQPGG